MFTLFFDYCIIWGNCNTALENRLVRFQKRAAKIYFRFRLFNSFCSFV